MDSIVISRLDDRLKCRPRILAALQRRSVEEEAKAILSGGCGEKPQRNHREAIRTKVETFGDVELEMPSRRPVRGLPGFEEILKSA